MALPTYTVSWTYDGHKGTETAKDFKAMQELVTDLLYTGKRGATITIVLV
jgi:hypothetical protein